MAATALLLLLTPRGVSKSCLLLKVEVACWHLAAKDTMLAARHTDNTHRASCSSLLVLFRLYSTYPNLEVDLGIPALPALLSGILKMPEHI